MDDLMNEQINIFDEKEVGKRIRKLRQERGYSLDELANRAYVSRSYLSQVERGERSITLDYVKRIATGLNMTPDEMFFRESSGYEAYLQTMPAFMMDHDLSEEMNILSHGIRDTNMIQKRKIASSLREKMMQDICAIMKGSTDSELKLIYRFITQMMGLTYEEE